MHNLMYGDLFNVIHTLTEFFLEVPQLLGFSIPEILFFLLLYLSMPIFQSKGQSTTTVQSLHVHFYWLALQTL